MKKLQLVITLALFACGSDRVGDGSEMSPDSGDDAASDGDCELGSACSDRFECGEVGNSCVGILHIGECIGGVCGPRLHGCLQEAPQGWSSCAEFCASDGGTCAANACDGATIWGWPISGTELCSQGTSQDVETPRQGDCDTPLDFSDPDFVVQSCCCDFPD